MLGRKLREQFVFDANFYICMLSIKAPQILSNLEKAAKELGYDYFMSEIVFNEIKAPTTFKTRLNGISNVEKVDDHDIEMIKNTLKTSGIRFPAQDPDLSLLALSQFLLNGENNIIVHLVTDDFKLAKNAALMYKGKLNILSLSSFLLKLHRTLTNSRMRKYFKNIWKRSLNYTLSYMIERSKIYPAEEKITWLIERAVSVTEDSIITQDHYLEDKKVEFGITKSKYQEEIDISEKYIEGQSLPQSEEEKVQGFITFLENLKISREYLKRTRDSIVKNDSKNAVKFLKTGNAFLISLLQLALGQLHKIADYEIIEQMICSEISKMEFLRAFLLVSLGRINSAIDSLERAALFSTIIHNYNTCLTLNYLKALILLFHGLYTNSILAYNFTEELSESFNEEKLKLKCAIGKAIALYLQGGNENINSAVSIMREIADINFEENIKDAIIVFSELGDYFLALGHSQIATNLYNESMEMAIDAGLDWKVDILIQKLKRAYISTVLNGYTTEDVVDKLDILLDKAYSVKDIDKYNEQIRKISSFNSLFYSPFPHLSGNRKQVQFRNLPKELQEDFLDVVHIDKAEKEYILFIVSHYDLGLLGIRLKTDENITGVAENYKLKIKPTSKVKIYAPDDELRDVYLIRAIIEVIQKEGCEIVYTLPSFFSQLGV